jgi:hypothetical protein
MKIHKTGTQKKKTEGEEVSPRNNSFLYSGLSFCFCCFPPVFYLLYLVCFSSYAVFMFPHGLG